MRQLHEYDSLLVAAILHQLRNAAFGAEALPPPGSATASDVASFGSLADHIAAARRIQRDDLSDPKPSNQDKIRRQLARAAAIADRTPLLRTAILNALGRDGIGRPQIGKPAG
jgi:hypothetical protein